MIESYSLASHGRKKKSLLFDRRACLFVETRREEIRVNSSTTMVAMLASKSMTPWIRFPIDSFDSIETLFVTPLDWFHKPSGWPAKFLGCTHAMHRKDSQPRKRTL